MERGRVRVRRGETMKSLGKQRETLIAKHICDLFERTFNKLPPKIYVYVYMCMYVLCMRIYLCDGLLKPLSKRSEPTPSQCHSSLPHIQQDALRK